MDADRLEHLLRALPPAPRDWVTDVCDLIQTMAADANDLAGLDVHSPPHDHADDLPDIGAGHDPLDPLDPLDPGHHGHDDHGADGGDGW